jgi:hypothetical protein
MDLDTGSVELIISVADIVSIPYPGQTFGDRHYVNHLSWNPAGTRFLFFNRWSGPGQPTRVFTANREGSDLRLLSAHGASHWTWRDDEHVLIWAEGAYRIYQDNGSGKPIETVWKHPNGHQSFLPGTDNAWLLTDTYPQGKNIQQELCLYHIPTRKKHLLAVLVAPKEYSGEWRCDLHPRLNRKGTKVVIDSPHEGNGRQMYMIDIPEDVIRYNG